MTLAMLVVGGMNSLWGAVIGTLVVTTIGELLLRIELASGVLNLREVGLALVMLAILILRPPRHHERAGARMVSGERVGRLGAS